MFGSPQEIADFLRDVDASDAAERRAELDATSSTL